jgi:integrase
MAKLTVSITHVAWREGRPRFVPGPKLRKIGFKGEDLRHGDGNWFTAAEAKTWADAKEREIAARRQAVVAARVTKRRLAPLSSARAAALTVGDLFDVYFQSPRMKGEAVSDGKRRQKAAAPATIRDYRKKADALAKFDEAIWAAPAEALSKPIVYDLYERMWTRQGLATARGAIAVLSAALSWGLKRGKIRMPANPCEKLGMEMPDARLRCLSPAEVRHIVAAADALGRPEIGDAIVMGVWTGQRQKDRLELVDRGLIDGRRVFQQSKTKAVVEIRQAPELEARLTRSRARREDWKVQPLELIVDEKTREPFKGDWYRHVYAQVRAAAVAGVRDAMTGAWIVEPMASLADARDQDLRDTAVTWLARAGCTHAEIGQITGHSDQSIQSILRHYLSRHREMGDNAIAKLLAWYEGQGEAK